VIRAVLFDFGETLVERIVDDESPLSDLLVVAYSDAAPTLDRLVRDGYRLAIVSNTTQSTERDMRTALGTIGLEPYFDAVVTSFDVGHEKPHGDIFRRALDSLGCTAANAVMVGNDPVADVGGAAALGMATVLVARPSATRHEIDVTPTFVVASLDDLPELVREIGLSSRARDRGPDSRY
jgi:putative hydrolase of the HAD superfamily